MKKEGVKSHRGSAAVELSLIMLLYMSVVFMAFQCFFILISKTDQKYQDIKAAESCTIEETLKSIRKKTLLSDVVGSQ